jgi:hypothetical protein
MSIALVTKGRLYPKASSSGEPIIIVRRDHYVDISAEIVDTISIAVDMSAAEEICVDIIEEDISVELTVQERIFSEIESTLSIESDNDGCQ